MSRSQRFALVVIAAAVAVAAFVIAKPGGDGNDNGRPAATAPAKASPPTTRIEVRNGKPGGRIRTISVKKGERVRLSVSSADTASEVHVHGYDLKKDMEPGRPVSFSFPADIEGVFEIELEDAGTQIARLEVRPR